MLIFNAVSLCRQVISMHTDGCFSTLDIDTNLKFTSAVCVIYIRDIGQQYMHQMRKLITLILLCLHHSSTAIRAY